MAASTNSSLSSSSWRCADCAKTSVMLLNFLLAMGGLAVLGIGLWFRVRPDILDVVQSYSHWDLERTTNMSKLQNTAAYIIIAIGVVVCLLGILGCIGGCLENKKAIVVYIALMIIFLLGGLAVLAWALNSLYTEKSMLEKNPHTVLAKHIEEYTKSKTSKEYIDSLQQLHKCCGINSYVDWYWKYNYHNHSGYFVPQSCCVSNYSTCNQEAAHKSKIKYPKFLYLDGCSKVTAEKNSTDVYVKLMVWIGIIGGLTALLEIVCIALALYLFRLVEDVDEEWKQNHDDIFLNESSETSLSKSQTKEEDNSVEFDGFEIEF